ncbi:hypothetical protein A9Q84_12195 [Halobacteriovorax marinus]|uniref:Uncharacterized protein n=1 Tax=Halobacteriovorax marinus TaxID=97084 RepID=A0A1Y5F8K4_9BACT|nr:hypothetical protein A9Q84_12195 [Halobacteriovorax marinus]
MKPIVLISLLAVLASCGDKHTFDTPVPKDGRFQQQRNSNSNSKDIVLINAHTEASDYYHEKFTVTYLDKLNDISTISDKDKQSLKSELNKVLKWEHTRVPGKKDSAKRCARNSAQSNSCYSHAIDTYKDYSRARTYLYGKIDLKTNADGEYYLDTIYCQKQFTTNDLSKPQYAIGPMRKPDYNTINAEHVWPRSKFEEIKDTDYYNIKLSDLHNLFPSFVKSNGERSNYSFGNLDSTFEVVKDFSRYCPSSTGKVFKKLGTSNSAVKFFEAPDEVKGDIARAMFYMSTRYYNYKKPTTMNIDSEQEAVLRKWHKLDPVSAEERRRNNEVFTVQHNRNPFVDYPQLVELINDL